MRDQFKITYNIGTPAPHSLPPNSDPAQMLDAVRVMTASIARAASDLCGGLFVSGGTGYWVERENAAHAENFDGVLTQEVATVFEVTTEPHKLTRVLSEMRRAIRHAVDEAKVLDVEWVHVTIQPIQGDHFNVKEV